MANELVPETPDGKILIYEDGGLNVQVRIDGETVWLTQRLIADLFQVTVPNVNQHLRSIYEDGELQPEATVKRYLIVQTEGSRQVSRLVDHYNLDAILAVGYRVRSARGTAFRQAKRRCRSGTTQRQRLGKRCARTGGRRLSSACPRAKRAGR